MSEIKAIDMVELRKILYEKDLYEKFRRLLSKELRWTFRSLVATTWVPIETYATFVAGAATMLFPDQPEPEHEVGRLLTPRTLNSIYKAFIRIPKVSFLAKRAGFIWRTYYQKGCMDVEESSEQSVTLVVKDFPEFPLILMKKTGGSIRGIIELTNAKNVKVEIDDRNPAAWAYLLTWE